MSLLIIQVAIISVIIIWFAVHRLGEKTPRRNDGLLKVYVYSWDTDIIDRWPKGYSHHRLSIEEAYQLNYGLGPLIDGDRGIYRTHQYSIFTTLYSQLLSSSFITHSPDEADIFFIPYDLGMDSSTRVSDGALTSTNCPKVRQVMDLLEKSPYFHRNHGKDHFLLHSINQPMTWFANHNCTKLYELCLHCVKLSLDTYTADTYHFLSEQPYMTHNWYSIPFPSNYHMSSSVKIVAWKKVLQSSYFPTQYKLDRPHKVCFMGSTEVTAERQARLRKLIMQTCNDHKGCQVIPLSSHSSNVDLQAQVAKVQKAPFPIHNPYESCRICLQPGGDFPTRKGFFDAMLGGCIPVTFQTIAAQTQWSWFWMNNSNAMTATIFIPRESVWQNMTSTLDHLVQQAEDVSFLWPKVKMIAMLGDRFQYNLPYDNSGAGVKGGVKDAFQVIMENLQQLRSTEMLETINLV